MTDFRQSVLYCAICYFVRQGVPNPAIVVLNGQSVCEEHEGYVQGDPHASAIALAQEQEQEARR